MRSPLAFSYQYDGECHEDNPNRDAEKNEPPRRRLLSNKLAQNQRASREVGELSNSLAECRSLSRLQS